MILKSFEVRPAAEMAYFGLGSETAYTGRNKVLIEVECNNDECNKLYNCFKNGGKDEHEENH